MSEQQQQTPGTCPICRAIEVLRETGLGGYANDLHEYRQAYILPMVEEHRRLRQAAVTRQIAAIMVHGSDEAERETFRQVVAGASR